MGGGGGGGMCTALAHTPAEEVGETRDKQFGGGGGVEGGKRSELIGARKELQRVFLTPKFSIEVADKEAE